LDSSACDPNIKVGSKLDLPHWLVKSIYNDKFKFVSIDIPKQYKKFYHEILKADPCVVDLRKLAQFFYDFGLMVVGLLDDDMGKSIGRLLLWVFRNRFRRIMDLAGQTDHQDLYKSITKLDATETEIYKAGQSDLVGFLRWQRREFCKLLPSAIVSANKNKRKRADSDAENQPL
jgi:GINS complex subunit 3